MPASLAELLIKTNDPQNKGGLIDIEPNAGEVRYGATDLIDGLRPFVSTGAQV
jgi:NAD(P)H dehydrogenase (quinone)